MQNMINNLKLKIIKKEGHESELVKLSTIAKVMGYSNSTSVFLKSLEVGIRPVRVGKYYKIEKKHLEKLLTALVNFN